MLLLGLIIIIQENNVDISYIMLLWVITAFDLQSERLRQSILEKVQAKQFEALASVEDKILRKNTG
jgi:hypothetical protein